MAGAERAGIALVMIAAALWATVGLSGQIMPAVAALPPEALALARLSIAGPVLLVAALAPARGRRSGRTRLDPRALAVFALAGVLFQLCLFRCFAEIGVTTTVFLTVCLPPVMAAGWAIGWNRAPVAGSAVAALALAVVALALFSLPGVSGEAGRVNLPGLATASLASAAFFAMSSAARSLTRRAPPLLVAGAGLSLSAVLVLPVVVWTGAASATAAALSDPGVRPLLLWLGLGPTALAYICYCAGLAACRSTLVALIASMVEPVIAAALAAAVLQERLSPPDMVACLLLLLAMTTLMRGDRPARVPARTEPARALPSDQA